MDRFMPNFSGDFGVDFGWDGGADLSDEQNDFHLPDWSMNDNAWTYDVDIDFPKGPFFIYEQGENGDYTIPVPIMPHISGLHDAAVRSCRERHQRYREAWHEFRRRRIQVV